MTVATDGTVTAQFSNGLSQDVYKIPLATFTNPNGLGQMTGNAYTATKASGPPDINLANSGAAGTIQSKSLEGSTVDLATEFTNLITTQRAYSASRPHHHHGRSDAAAAGTVADAITIIIEGPRKARKQGLFAGILSSVLSVRLPRLLAFF